MKIAHRTTKKVLANPLLKKSHAHRSRKDYDRKSFRRELLEHGGICHYADRLDATEWEYDARYYIGVVQ